MELFICHTPLQMLIAQALIQQLNIQNYGFIVCFYTDYKNDKLVNKKFDYYIHQLKQKSDYFLSVAIEKCHSKERFLFYRNLVKQIKPLKINRVFVASIDIEEIQLIISHLNFRQLNTMDDGVINIIKDSWLYQTQRFSISRRFKRWMSGICYQVADLRTLSQVHYSIFKDQPNIIENVEFISLFDNLKSVFLKNNALDQDSAWIQDEFANQFCTVNVKAKSKKVIKILLGQPIFENAKTDKKMGEQLLKFVQPDF